VVEERVQQYLEKYEKNAFYGDDSPIVVRQVAPDLYQVVNGRHRLHARIRGGFAYIFANLTR
jgi:hypothetical protein